MLCISKIRKIPYSIVLLNEHKHYIRFKISTSGEGAKCLDYVSRFLFVKFFEYRVEKWDSFSHRQWAGIT
jgi:hypothetical protein